MKNKRLLLIAIMLLILMAFLLVSCNDSIVQNTNTGKGNEDTPKKQPYTGTITDAVKVSFRAPTGKLLTTITTQRGYIINPPEEIPSNGITGYYFTGWVLNGELFDFENTEITQDLKLNASYSNLYTVNFYDVDGTTPLGSTIVEYRKKVATNQIPQGSECPEHYHFAGWQVKGESTLMNLETDLIKEDLDLILKYSIDTHQVRFIDSTTKQIYVDQEVPFGEPAKPITISGSSSIEYKTKDDSIYLFNEILTSDLVLYVTPISLTHTVTFVCNSTTVETQQVSDGYNAIAPQNKNGKLYSYSDQELLCIKSDKTIVLSEVDAEDYTIFNPNVKTDISNKEISWNSSGVYYYLYNEGHYFEYTGYLAGPIVCEMSIGAQFAQSDIRSTLKVTLDGTLYGYYYVHCDCGLSNSSSLHQDVTLCTVSAGQHTVKIEVLSTTFNEDLVSPDSNMNDFGVGIHNIQVQQDLAKLFYTVKYYSYDETTLVKEEQVAYGKYPTFPVNSGLVETEESILPQGQIYQELLDQREYAGWMYGVVKYTETTPITQNVDLVVKYTMQKTKTITFYNENSELLGSSTVIYGSPAHLPSNASSYYALVNEDDLGKVLNVTEDANVVLKEVNKSKYTCDNVNKWTKIVEGTFIGTSTQTELVNKYGAEFVSINMKSYGPLMNREGDSISLTFDCAGSISIRVRDDKNFHNYILNILVDGYLVQSQEIQSGDIKEGEYIDYYFDVDVDIPAGTHTIKMELVYADDSKAQTKFQSWSGLLVPNIVIAYIHQ